MPFACKSEMTFDQLEPSAHAPWTNMTWADFPSCDVSANALELMLTPMKAVKQRKNLKVALRTEYLLYLLECLSYGWRSMRTCLGLIPL
jgi:hypothetical protein